MREKMLERFDRQWILSSLEQNDWNITAAARKLGIDRKNLAKRMKELGLEQDHKKAA
jgi:DNA-binding NtrC family response regulator